MGWVVIAGATAVVMWGLAAAAAAAAGPAVRPMSPAVPITPKPARAAIPTRRRTAAFDPYLALDLLI
jgi:hypothetical protein